MKDDPVRARALGALKKFRTQVRQLTGSKPSTNPEKTLGRLDDIVRTYFAEKLNLVRHAHTFEELLETVDGRADIEGVRDAYTRFESQTYRAGGSPDIGSDLPALIQRVEKTIQNINASLS